MDEEIFGEKAKNFKRSPENLSDYIHVSSPGIWILMIGMLVLFVGAFVWLLFGHIDKTISVYVYSQNGEISCFVDEAHRQSVAEGQKVWIENKEGEVLSAPSPDDISGYCEIYLPDRLPDGIHVADIYVQRIKPISLITN